MKAEERKGEMPSTRSEDAPGNKERIEKIRGEGRRRTIVLSIITAGLTSLFIGHFYETEAYNNQAERSRENCQGLQQLGRNLTEVALDVSQRAASPDMRKRWSTYADDFDNTYPPEGKSCSEIFPKRGVLPFIG